MNNPLRLLQLNDVRLVGRLTRDPEVRYTPKGQAVARLGLAVNRRYKDGVGEWREETTFVSITVWREAAERCRERLKKGSPIYVEGRLRSSSWETKEGEKRSALEVEAYRLQFLAKTSPEENAGAEDAPVGTSPEEPLAQNQPAGVAVESTAVPSRGQTSEDDIPF